MLFSDRADAQRDEAGALGDEPRRAHAVFAIGQRGGEMLGVDDDDIGFRHLGHHPRPRQLDAQAADAALGLRVAVLILLLVLDLLPAHLELVAVLPDLPRHFEHRHRRQGDGKDQKDLARQRRDVVRRVGPGLRRDVQKIGEPALHQPTGDRADHDELDDRLDDLGQHRARKQPAKPLQRVDAGKVRRYWLG